MPFGAKCYFMPSPPRCTMDKAEPTLRPGIFMGYRTPPGGLWDGDYLVCDIDDFANIPLHTQAEPGLFKNCKPHITRTVKFTHYGADFPLFNKYIRENETIEGIDVAMRMMQREKGKKKA